MNEDIAAGSPLVTIAETVYQGQQAYQVTTPAATYILHRQGGGLAALIDPQGNDWISYRPGGGSDGKYRGIPNLKYPEGYLHPGNVNAESRIVSSDSLCTQILVESKDAMCQALWSFQPQFVSLKLLRAPIPYWFLYEGTPGGRFDEDACYIVRSTGLRTSARETWDDTLNPGWLYFGNTTSPYILFLAQHETEAKHSSYWPMENNMTVFGFGRKGLEHYLVMQPAEYFIGLLPVDEFSRVRARIEEITAQ
jgi:hypothetical protein